MTHRAIGSRWRCITDEFTSFRRGEIAVVVDNVGEYSNQVRRERDGTIIRSTFSLDVNYWAPADEVAAPVPPPAAPVRFEPAANEMYIVVYRPTREFARRSYGTGNEVRSAQNRFTLINGNSPSTAHPTLEEARRTIRTVLGTNRDYDAYIIPLRAIEHWNAGNRQELGVEIVQAQAVPAGPDDDEDDD